MESVQVGKKPLNTILYAWVKKAGASSNEVTGRLMRLTENWWNVPPSDKEFLQSLYDTVLKMAQDRENIRMIALTCLASKGDYGEAVDRRLKPEEREALHELTQHTAQGAVIQSVLGTLLDSGY